MKTRNLTKLISSITNNTLNFTDYTFPTSNINNIQNQLNYLLKFLINLDNKDITPLRLCYSYYFDNLPDRKLTLNILFDMRLYTLFLKAIYNNEDLKSLYFQQSGREALLFGYTFLDKTKQIISITRYTELLSLFLAIIQRNIGFNYFKFSKSNLEVLAFDLCIKSKKYILYEVDGNNLLLDINELLSMFLLFDFYQYDKKEHMYIITDKFKLVLLMLNECKTKLTV